MTEMEEDMEVDATDTGTVNPGASILPNATASTIDQRKSVSVSSEAVSRKSTDNDNQPLAKLSFLSAVELRVFKTFVTNYVATRELRREDAIALDFIFGPTIQQVFEMVEEEQVTIRQSPMSRRILIEVCGKSGDTYWIPPGHSLCQCMAFVHGKREYCKHVLAAHFYLAITPKKDYKIISDDELSKVYKDCFEEPLGLK